MSKTIIFITVLLLTGGISMADDAPKTKCDDMGFKHAWENVTPNIVYPTYPPQYPPPTYKCPNCGLIKKVITTETTKYEVSL